MRPRLPGPLGARNALWKTSGFILEEETRGVGHLAGVRRERGPLQVEDVAHVDRGGQDRLGMPKGHVALELGAGRSGPSRQTPRSTASLRKAHGRIAVERGLVDDRRARLLGGAMSDAMHLDVVGMPVVAVAS